MNGYIVFECTIEAIVLNDCHPKVFGAVQVGKKRDLFMDKLNIPYTE